MVKLTPENIADIEWALERGKSADVRYMSDKKSRNGNRSYKGKSKTK